jgi:hypothetical protein
MKTLTNQLIKVIIQNRVFTFCLGTTLLFFLCKGILYALIGSFVPLLFIITILSLFLFSFIKTSGTFARAVTMWSFLLILWSATRILLSFINQFVKHVPEGHIDGQLGLTSNLVSFTILICSLYMLNNRKSIKTCI